MPRCSCPAPPLEEPVRRRRARFTKRRSAGMRRPTLAPRGREVSAHISAEPSSSLLRVRGRTQRLQHRY
jgi:hypothetical protein